MMEKVIRGSRPPRSIDPAILRKVINRISADSKRKKDNENFMKLISDYFRETRDLPSVIDEDEAK